MNEQNNKNDDVCCPKCCGTGYLNHLDYEPPCDLCCETGVVSKNDADDFDNEAIPVEYWWAETEDGQMVMVEVDRDND